ncbi:hypothetical protein, partial [Treponema sp.]|uniref:hypothetical protein n=1 Tax=Treponema sp. TaxID=166 RepID=UPI00257D6F58
FNEYDYETDIQVKTEEAERRGHAAGLEEGTRNARVETAEILLKEGVSVQTIMKSTGLSEEKILKIK